jgi:hypothetical protein
VTGAARQTLEGQTSREKYNQYFLLRIAKSAGGLTNTFALPINIFHQHIASVVAWEKRCLLDGNRCGCGLRQWSTLTCLLEWWTAMKQMLDVEVRITLVDESIL